MLYPLSYEGTRADQQFRASTGALTAELTAYVMRGCENRFSSRVRG
jgi:hypothetical protein